MKSWRSMSAEWRRLGREYDDPRQTIVGSEYLRGAFAALIWAYSDRAPRPSTAVHIEDLPR